MKSAFQGHRFTKRLRHNYRTTKYLPFFHTLQCMIPSVLTFWKRQTYGEGNGNPLQYSCPENSIDRGTWWAIVHGFPKSWTQLSDSHTHTHGDSRRISGSRGLVGEEGWIAKHTGYFSLENTLYETIMVDTCHYTFPNP